MNLDSKHYFYMKAALKQAQKAKDQNEVPVGAVIVHNKTGKIIAKGFNKSISKNNPAAHAEMEAIIKACKIENNYRLTDHTIYVTLEPCPMCAGAIIQARIGTVYYGASDEKGGAVENNAKVFSKEFKYNHKPNYKGGILREESIQLLKEFFINKRIK